MIVNPLLLYEIRGKYATTTVQVIMVTIIYISPRATAKEESEALDRLHRLSGTRAVITGAMNANHTTWDTRCNLRARHLTRWTQRHAWHIIEPGGPSFQLPTGASSTDIFLVNGMDTYAATTRTDMTYIGRNQLLVELEIRPHNRKEEQTAKRHTLRKQRRER